MDGRGERQERIVMGQAIDERPRFNYAACGGAAGTLRMIVDEVKALVSQGNGLVISIGTQLITMKGLVPRGQFGAFLDSEFGWSQDTAERWMAVAKRFAAIPQAADFDRTALYALAGGDIPDEAIEEATERAAAGEKITKAVAVEIIDKHTEGEKSDYGDADEPMEPATFDHDPAATAPEPPSLDLSGPARQVGDNARTHEAEEVILPPTAFDELLELLGECLVTAQRIRETRGETSGKNVQAEATLDSINEAIDSVKRWRRTKPRK